MTVVSLRKRAKSFRRQILVVYYAARDSRTPWFARVLAFAVAAYALSPIDLVPDFIPVLGYLEDLVIVPLGLMLVLRLIPREVLAASRIKAEAAAERPVSRGVAAAIVGLWIFVAVVLGLWAWRVLRT